MKLSTCPIVVVPTSLSDDGKNIIFSTIEQIYEIASSQEMWKVLSLCDGFNSVLQISKQSKLDKEFVSNIIEDLASLDIVCDSREQFTHFHKITNNPSRFWRDLTSEEIMNHVNSPRLPIKSGETYDFQTDSSLSVYKLSKARTSCRSFASGALSKSQIGSILSCGYSSQIKPVPSGGALNPLKIYVVVTSDQKDLPCGYYEYDAESDTLVLFDDNIDIEQLKYIYDSETIPFNSSVLIIIAAELYRQPYKYSNRGYRFTLMECGAVAQNISLACVELGVASVELGGALDEPLARELRLEEAVFPLLSIAIGKESPDGFEDSYDLLYRLDSDMVGIKKAVRKVSIIDDIQADGFFFASALANVAPDEDARSSYANRFSFGVANSMAMAKVKAIAEAYERHRSGRVKVNFYGSASEIDGLWIDPRNITPMSGEQQERLHLQNFSEDLALEWVVGRKYLTGEDVLVPIDMVNYPVNEEKYARQLICDSNSSGVAASTTYEDAETRALLELIERDAVMRSWFTQHSPNKLDVNALPEHWKRRKSYWESLGRQVHVLDMSISGVDIIQVIIEGEEFPSFANGCAAVICESLESYVIAVRKAFQEAEFALLSAQSVGRKRTRRALNVRNPIEHAEYYSSKIHAKEISWLWSGDYAERRKNIVFTTDEIIKKTYDIVTVDLSEDKSPLKAVRVISEHLIPMNFGFGNDYFLHPRVKELDFDDKCRLIPHYFA